MALGGGMSCVKYLLFLFNLLFAITGLIILVVGIRAEINASPYIDFTDSNFYTSAPIVLIIVGVIVFIVAFFGCCGAVKENHCMIVTFSVFLLLIFVAELGVGIAGYVKHKDVEQNILNSMNASMSKYPTNNDIKTSFDIVQTDFQCCGIKGPEDWSAHGLPIPESCCSVKEIVDGATEKCSLTNKDIHKTGCLEQVVNHLTEIVAVLGGVGLGIAIVQLLGVIFACCLARSIRSQYETV